VKEIKSPARKIKHERLNRQTRICRETGEYLRSKLVLNGNAKFEEVWIDWEKESRKRRGTQRIN